MIEMSNREYSEFTRDLFAKFNAGEMTAEEVCAELDKVDRVWFENPREPHDVPDDYIPPRSNCLYKDSRDFNKKVRCKS